VQSPQWCVTSTTENSQIKYLETKHYFNTSTLLHQTSYKTTQVFFEQGKGKEQSKPESSGDNIV
jgi:hypothetical protein